MRYLLPIVLLIPTICLALGADSQEFVGVSQDGKLTKIGFISHPEKWSSEYSSIYGSLSNPKFRYCWTNEEPIDTTNPEYSDRQSTHFVCSSKRGLEPTVFYKHGNYSYSNGTGLRYEEAMANFAKARKAGYSRNKDYIIEYYICDKGCDATMPIFIFEVAFED